MQDKEKILNRLRALKNYALESEDSEIQAIGSILQTVYIAYRQGHEFDLMKVLMGFTMDKIEKNNKSKK